MKKNTLLSVFTFLTMAIVYGQSTATYTIVFDSNWSQATHPDTSGSLPGNAHWSKLVGATHNDAISFLEMGSPATPGVKIVAETGGNTVFFSEINAAIADNTANNLIEGPALATDLGSMTINNLETTEDFPLLTLASMIAPSPDWMVAISNLSLLDDEGIWIDELAFDVYAYDAGTDSGETYTAANQATNPVDVITPMQGVAPFSTEPIGTFTITLESVLGVTAIDEASFNLSPNPTTGIITVRSENTISTIEVYTILGARVISKDVQRNNAELDLTALSSGAYIVKLTDSNANSQIKKVIKQ